jgi:hypothetical protein
MTTTSGCISGRNACCPRQYRAVSAAIVLSHPAGGGGGAGNRPGGIVRRGLGYDLATWAMITT